MIRTVRASVAPRRRGSLRRVLVVCLLLCALLALVGVVAAPVGAQAAPGPSVAQVAVYSFTSGATDEISFKILGNQARQPLVDIVQTLAVLYGQLPTNVTYFDKNPDDANDVTAMVRFHLPIVSHAGGRLPIDPFIQAFASYASQLTVAYVIYGSYAYQPFQTQYATSEVQLSEDPPNISPDNAANPFAIYVADVKILNQHLAAPSATSTAQSVMQGRRRTIIVIAICAALFILALGVVVALLLPRRKEQEIAGETANETTDIASLKSEDLHK